MPPWLRVMAIAWVLLALPARGADAGKEQPSAAEKRYRDALARGQERYRKGDWAGAIKAFKVALEASDDPVAWDALSAAALQAKNLPLAEQAAREVLEKTTDAELIATALLHLGRVEEARSNKAKAIETYRESLGRRLLPEARERLTALDPEATEQLNAWKPEPMKGPFATIEAYCGPAPTVCGAPVGDVKGDREIEAVSKPFQAVRLVSEHTRGDEALCGEDGCVAYVLAVQTSHGWFVTPPLAIASVSPWGFDHQSFAVEVLELRDVAPAEGKEIILQMRITSVHGHAKGTTAGEQTGLLVLGVGPSQVPSASKLVTIATSTTGGGGAEAHVDYDFKDGALAITGDARRLGASPLRNLLGAHRLRFP